MLVAVSFYIGSEKEFTGTLPFTILVCATAVCMVGSEIIANTRRKRIEPTKMTNPPTKRIVSNLFPFTTLNVIFAFSILVAASIKVVERTQTGVPKLSIQSVVMQLCLFLTNTEAKSHFKKKFSTFICSKLVENTNQTVIEIQDNTNIEKKSKSATQNGNLSNLDKCSIKIDDDIH